MPKSSVAQLSNALFRNGPLLHGQSGVLLCGTNHELLRDADVWNIECGTQTPADLHLQFKK